MADIIYLKSRAKDRIYNQFPPLSSGEVPLINEIQLIEYKNESIAEYDVIFWHRLLKTIYEEPLESECELYEKNQLNINNSPEIAIYRRLEEKSKWEILNTTQKSLLKIQAGEITPMPVNWKYFFRLPSGGLIEIGTKDKHTLLYVAHIVDGTIKDEDIEQAENFISLLLDAAKKEGNQLFNPLNEFKKSEGLKFYHLFNVYRANYISAELMLEMAMTQEKNLLAESVRYDARTNDLYDEEKRNHMERYMLACGMYYSSAITYFFIALEGFINIVFHSFLKKDIRDSDLNNIEKRFDIEEKFKLMPSLCHGFRSEYLDSPIDVYKRFRQLTNYRNSIFHSKVEEALKTLVFIEDGFLYGCDVSKYKVQFLPIQKNMLNVDSVIEVRTIVDDIIQLILKAMTEDTRLLTEKYILNSADIPFFILKDGSHAMGRSDAE